MLRATEVIARGDWREAAADTVVLDFEDRHRRRIAMEGVGGLSFLLDLEEAVALRTGDAVKLEANKTLASTVEFLVARGIPVMAHIGLMPQFGDDGMKAVDEADL